MPRTEDIIADWKAKLIDLGGRNRLIYFRPARSSSLEILEPDLNAVFQRIAIAERPWQFFFPVSESQMMSNRSQTELFQEEASLRRSKRKATELLCRTPGSVEGAASQPDEQFKAVYRALKNLHRKARTDEEERGITTLHLTFGFLKWQEQPNSEPVLSPLILVPVRMVRADTLAPFSVARAEGDITVNPAIAVKLRDSFQVELPESPADWEDDSLARFLVQVRNKVKKRGWEVSEACWLSTLSYHRLVIYEDLKNHEELVSAHPLTQALASEASYDDYCEQPSLPDPDRLDETLDPSDSYLILDADSSQLACVQAVRKGCSLVVQGPPGTGKSQTIANILADCIASGRKALFVSEKMAALEVVLKRLTAANLDHYCLDLHSTRANKREVVKELARCLRESQRPRMSSTGRQLEKLTRVREKLNAYVQALHETRLPMETSAYHVLGELARLEEVPCLELSSLDPGAFSYTLLDSASDLAHELAGVWHIVSCRPEFPWVGCTARTFNPQTRLTFERLLNQVVDSANWVISEFLSLSTELECTTPSDLSGCDKLLTLMGILAECPGIERSWLEKGALVSLRGRSCEARALCDAYKTIRKELTDLFEESYLALSGDTVLHLEAATESLQKSFGPGFELGSTFMGGRRRLLEWSEGLSRRLRSWSEAARGLAEQLYVACPETIREFELLLRLLGVCNIEFELVPGWLRPDGIEAARQAVTALRKQSELREQLRRDLFAEYDESVLSLDLEALLGEVSATGASWTRWLRPRFHRIRSTMRQHRRDKKSSFKVLKDLRLGAKVAQLEKAVDRACTEYQAALGLWYRGYDTDFESLEAALASAEMILSCVRREVPSGVVDFVCKGTGVDDSLATLVDKLAGQVGNWKPSLETVLRDTRTLDLPGWGHNLDRIPFERLASWAETLRQSLLRLNEVVEPIEAMSLDSHPRSADVITRHLARLADFHRCGEEFGRESETYGQIFGRYWNGFDTDWPALFHAIDWLDCFLHKLGDLDVTESIAGVVSEGGQAAPPYVSAQTARDAFEAAMLELAEHFDTDNADSAMRVAARGKPLRSATDLCLRDKAIESCPMEEVIALAHSMANSIEQVRDWIDYRKNEEAFARAGLAELHGQLIHNPDLQPESLPQVTRRSLLTCWVDGLYQDDPVLGMFRGQKHDRIIKEFRELDVQLREMGYARVIEEAERRKPVHSESGEPSILLREAEKKRRHLPLRTLFAKIPNLLFRLKPCLLMSPLSVSQYLDPQQIRFDVVVFDEASQVRPHEGISAVYRGKQLVVCGDSKQLPPTSFFEYEMSEDYYEEEELGTEPAAFESLLDQCLALDMPVLSLMWHYRSRHEELIAFSNARFYGNKLTTFPCPQPGSQTLGIDFLHVPSGVYHRGGRRDNPNEAKVVVDQLSALLREHPDQSVGIVALSIAQMNAIENELNDRLISEPDLRSLLKTDLLEGFFVKNLENVQGDERDVIIISIGYGRDENAKLSMNFGPMNREGGERRLNVAITRARSRVILVSSLLAGDLDLSRTESSGVRHLHAYLDYADRGHEALAMEITGTLGEAESPLEDDVADSIRGMGYIADSQVGCSGYRIDIGVRTPEQPGRYVIGVECDGATYHSAHTARDRDRLRQEVLERLGWQIHRIWSPEWASQRRAEEERLRKAIQEASRKTLVDTPPPRRSSSISSSKAHDVMTYERNCDNDAFDWLETYSIWKPGRNKTRMLGEIADPESEETLKCFIEEAVRWEGPIHIDLLTLRITRAWGLRRTGNRISAAIRKAVQSVVREKRATKKSSFLWSSGGGTECSPRQPDPEDDSTFRDVEHIPVEEIEQAVKEILSDALSISQEELIASVSRALGFNRTGQNIRARLGKVLRRMLKNGQVTKSDGMISLASERAEPPSS
jgi:very-short-patch-repair endonuclease